MDIVTLLAAAGLGGAAGQRAVLPALLLGVFHHTPWFELHESVAWLAAPVVLGTLVVLAIAEHIADRSESFGAMADTAARVPRWIAGFLVAAAGSGALDADLTALMVSGLVGTSAAFVMERGHARSRAGTRALAEGGVDLPDQGVAAAETGSVIGLTSAALFMPWIVLAIGVVTLVFGIVALRAGRRFQRSAARAGGLRGIDE